MCVTSQMYTAHKKWGLRPVREFVIAGTKPTTTKEIGVEDADLLTKTQIALAKLNIVELNAMQQECVSSYISMWPISALLCAPTVCLLLFLCSLCIVAVHVPMQMIMYCRVLAKPPSP